MVNKAKKKKVVNISTLLADKSVHTIPLLAIRGLTITPHTKMQLTISRNESVKSVRQALALENQLLAVCCQYDEKEENPQFDGLYPFGVIASILEVKEKDQFSISCLISGLKRFKLNKLIESDENSCRMAEIEIVDEVSVDEKTAFDYISTLRSSMQYAMDNSLEAIKPLIGQSVPKNIISTLLDESDLSVLTDELAQILTLDASNRLMLLGNLNPVERAQFLISFLNGYSYKNELERHLIEQAKASMERNQKEYFLNEQMRIIKKELKLDYDDASDVKSFRDRLKTLDAPSEVIERIKREIGKFSTMNANSAEYSMVSSYIETLLNIPWRKSSKINHDLKKAQEILEKEHYGLKKVKDRILEYLAVQAKSDRLHGPILCLMGPPGIGKTSLGQSIAKATGRNYVRVALGGLHDEAEIRGHRRTYIGALPGRIIQNMIKAKVNNPLFLLDEIDKVSDSIHGDPADALLEVLDPEQNSTFEDNYVELDYDLSNVMFVTTANSYNISQPLLDRMEIIDLSSYTEDEKYNIARNHLIPKQLRANALKVDEFDINDDAIYELIRYYTHEAGVRGLERLINELARKTIKAWMLKEGNKKRSKKLEKTSISIETIHELLGPRRYDFTSKLSENKVGLVNGLAWTTLGGDILQLEAVANEGKGKHQLTGKLGEVMKESIGAGMTLVPTLARSIHLDPSFYETCDLHIHVPEGATPKEGPSAGIGMVTAMVSALTGNPVKADVAMTGEITLRGDVLPICGLKEKLLAALRGGIKTVLIPFENEKDLWDIPENVKSSLNILPVKRIEEVLVQALENNPYEFKPTTAWSEEKSTEKEAIKEDKKDE